MKRTSRIWHGLKALRQLGPSQLGSYGLYQFGLRSGHYQRQLSARLTRLDNLDVKNLTLHPCLPSLPEPSTILNLLKSQVGILYQQADEIVDGRIRLFGGEPVALSLTMPGALEEWAKYEFMHGCIGSQDIKFIWEPARFGWACTLAMAYHLSRKEAYAKAFWQYAELFLAANPPYMGAHWCSAQEVAIRLVSLAFALQVFSQPALATEEQLKTITRSIAIHAERIPPTMVYARSQNNNHLIMEALGLYTASVLLPDHPFASKWNELGWRWLMNALSTQFEPDGTYSQHSTNYHRLMLQAALWALAIYQQSPYPRAMLTAPLEHLAFSTHWLSRMVDPKTGRVPNLGHNDGAYILPLTICPYHDYRPVLQAATQAFLGTTTTNEGPWNDMSRWLGITSLPKKYKENPVTWHKHYANPDIPVHPPYVLANPSNDSWAALNAARYYSRPAHADQLHLDLWWHGQNLALDPGTYLYNAPFPWENSLTSAFVHNTVTVDGAEFMQRAGRFLYLDWAQAKILAYQDDPERKSHTLAASHDGYRRLGITHTRTVTTFEDGHWEVEDRLDGSPGSMHAFRLHWLLPDWDYEILDFSQETSLPGYGVTLRSDRCKFTLQAGIRRPEVGSSDIEAIDFQLARNGQLLAGSGSVLPIAGYYSPTYGVKIPALAFILIIKGSLPITLKSLWILPRPKAAVILIKDNQIALIERQRQGKHYYVIPGGKIEIGETPEMAAAREATEELGLQVQIGRLVAKLWSQGRPQYYFLAEETGGTFGYMMGPEANLLPGSPKGTYKPIWMPVDELDKQSVLPEQIAKLVQGSSRSGWPEAPFIMPEPSLEEGA